MIQFHPRSGSLWLRNQCAKPIVYKDGDPTSDLTLARFPKDPEIRGLVHETCILYRQRNLLRIGDYEFVLDFDLRRADQETFRQERDLVLMREFGIRPSRHLDLVPLNHHHVAYNVCIHRRLSQSPDMRKSIFSGVRLHTGEPVAVKAMKCHGKKLRARVRSELYTANMFRDSDSSSGVLGLIDSWCSHGSPPCCSTAVSDNNSCEIATADNDATANETDEDETDETNENETDEDEVDEDEVDGVETGQNETLSNRINRNNLTEDDGFVGYHANHPHPADRDRNDMERDGNGSSLPDPHCTVVYYSMPLAEYNFADMCWADVDGRSRLRYFRQTLAGLRTMHSRGIVHGNISPKALVLQLDEATENTKAVDANSLPSLRAAISNLSNAWLTSHSRSRAGCVDHPEENPWIAPEIWDGSTRELTISMPADIWGLAVTWLHTFSPTLHGKITIENYKLLVQHVDKYVPGPLRGLVQQMIAWQPSKRPGAEEVLAHESWEHILDKKSQNKSVGIANVKRVRLLSPETEDVHVYDPKATLLARYLD